MEITVFKKMLLITLISITGLIGFMTLSQFQVGQVFTQTNYANTNIVPRIIALYKMRYKFNTLQIRLANHTLITDQAKIADVEQVIAQLQTELTALFNDYSVLVNDKLESKMLAADKVAANEYYVRMQPILIASNSNKKELARQLYIDIRATAKKANG